MGKVPMYKHCIDINADAGSVIAMANRQIVVADVAKSLCCSRKPCIPPLDGL